MKKFLLSLVFAIPLFIDASGQINIQWQTRYTSAGTNVDKIEDMVTDASGNVYVTGIGIGTSAGFDYVTIKYNVAGIQQWIAQYNGPGNSLDEAHAIAIDTFGNVYVTGWSYGGASTGFDYATVKYNSAGVQQWSSRYNHTTNGTDEAWDIAVDYAGNVYVTGTSDASTTNSAATTVKYDASGAQQYIKRFNGNGSGLDAGYAIYVEPVAGDIYVAGYTFESTSADFDFITVKYNTAGTQQWATQYNGPANNYDEARAIAVDASGNVYVTGYTQTAVLTNYDYATVKYNSAGVQQWARNYNGTGDDYDRANAIKLDPSGNVYITGKSIGVSPAAEDFVTIKYDNAGTQQWLNRYNGISNGYDEGKALALDTAGNIYVTGYSSNDFATIKYDTAGVQEWITKYNGTANSVDQAVAIAVDNIGNVFVAGMSRGAGSNEDFETIKYCQFTANAGTDVTICNGANTMLNASAPGASNYAWLPNDGTLSSLTSATPVANPVTTTSYYVAITNINGCVDLDTVVVTVVPLPSPVITADGPTSFCIGDSVVLTSGASNEYQWSTGANDTLPSITVNVSGTYTVVVTDTNGCSSSASQSVTVIPLPVINAGLNDSTCLSTNVNLAATGGNSYVWHPGTSLSDSTIANPIAGPVTSTTYTVIGTSAAGCVNSDTVRITVMGNPPLPSITKSNDTLFSSPAFSYQWYLNGSPLTGETGQTHVYTLNGNYYVEITNVLGCSTVSTVININDVGVSELELLSALNVYPNPATDEFNIEMDLAGAGNIKISLMTITGQHVFSEEVLQRNGLYRKQVSMKEYAKGIYYLQVITENGMINKKIIKN